MKKNYRIIRKVEPRDRITYAIYLVSYDEEGGINHIVDEPASPSGETLAELVENLEQIRRAHALPVLEMDEVLDAVEACDASEYGRWIREQMHEAVDPMEARICPVEDAETRRLRLEAIAARFAEKRRNEPHDDI